MAGGGGDAATTALLAQVWEIIGGRGSSGGDEEESYGSRGTRWIVVCGGGGWRWRWWGYSKGVIHYRCSAHRGKERGCNAEMEGIEESTMIANKKWIFPKTAACD
eukprot:TRINITY_DN30238_c0_g1_i1.p3 TRINITY_DN30238_c0_g1~~TRINITY_DN30238_c0_g1_i1.p3  ORF type:complete len:105 (-),score=6.38 TRINITY_DN30238_c0_g1_i1:33-347(-)